jgi:hypothetical protein
MFRTAASVLVASTLALQVVYPPAFPRPNATRLLETDRLVIWDIVWPEGQPTPMHRHLNDQVGTYYQAGGRRITTIDGAERETISEVGSLSDTRKGTTHIEEGITDPPLRAVFIEMKEEGPSSAAEGNSPEPPTFFPRIAQTSMLDDERVTVWEYGQTKSSSPLKGTTTRDTVIVWLGTGKLTTAASAPDSASTTVPIQPGKMEYLPKGTTITRQVTEGDPRAIVFEFK